MAKPSGSREAIAVRATVAIALATFWAGIGRSLRRLPTSSGATVLAAAMPKRSPGRASLRWPVRIDGLKMARVG